jgi:hypothetical protein
MARGGHGLPKVSPRPAMYYPTGRQHLTWPYDHFRGGSPAVLAVCGCLLPLWIPHAVSLCKAVRKAIELCTLKVWKIGDSLLEKLQFPDLRPYFKKLQTVRWLYHTFIFKLLGFVLKRRLIRVHCNDQSAAEQNLELDDPALPFQSLPLRAAAFSRPFPYRALCPNSLLDEIS